MDPTELLKRVRELADMIVEHSSRQCEEEANQLAECILDLDHWISMGGFLPKQWTQTKGE